MQIIAERAYETQDWKLNYRGVSAKGRILRCSTLFIKDERGALVGLLCINFDDSHFRELSERVFALCHPDDYAARNISISTMDVIGGAFGTTACAWGNNVWLIIGLVVNFAIMALGVSGGIEKANKIMAILKPWPSCPSRFSLGTFTLLKISSQVAEERMPILS